MAVAIGSLIASLVSAEDWPGFRGPTGMGLTTEKGLPLEWGGEEGKNVLWKVPLPPTAHKGDADHNQSSPVVADGKVFVTTAHWAAGTDKAVQPPEHHFACYEAETGAQLWDVIFRTRLPGTDPAVSPIATADGRIYFASAGKTVVIQAGPKLEILAESDLGDPSLATAAVADGRIFLKGKAFLYAIGNKKS